MEGRRGALCGGEQLPASCAPEVTRALKLCSHLTTGREGQSREERAARMAPVALRLMLLLIAGDLAASLNTQSADSSEYTSPNCDEYKLPGCPRDYSPVCGSDMITYPNECTLCMKIREESRDIKIIKSGPC
ncbi:serine protease inhibitor Kazal-type 2 [Talpa occidentalis]|uniref:serine protease inhibitor Kazal-type 2 n=1 Tax=Talpa occidentalis TaxID=50954 RepID=UPI00188F371B|nr:serine protease inhibitor Kazal-type 2 [Talpa occidentalis]